MQPDGVNLWYFKSRLLNVTELIVYKFKTLGCKDKGLENQSLWRRLNSFLIEKKNKEIWLLSSFGYDT